MGPLLSRLHKASISLPGGCVIGDRPIDLHLRGFEGLGAEVSVEGGTVFVEAEKELVGAEVSVRGIHGTTVLGTGNVMMAAVLAKGQTIITGAAAEPEVVDLANFLNAMGAKIEGAGTGRIIVEGVEELGGVEHQVIPDRIEAGTFLVAGAIAGKKLTLSRVERARVQSIIDILEKCGCEIECNRGSNGGTITISRASNPTGCNLTTEPYPGFPTDMQAQMCALFATTPGTSIITETVFPERFMHVPELKRLGAQIDRQGPSAIVEGVESLSGAPVMASDLRASAALVLAGLMAEGATEVNRLYHIDRGYEHIDEKLMEVGADMERTKD